MKRMQLIIIVFITIYITVSMSLFGDEIREYGQKKVRTIPIGNAEGEIGFRKMRGRAFGPTTFAISDEGLIYICDTINKRIVVHDLDLIFIRKIAVDNNSKIFYATKLVFSRNNEIIGVDSVDGLTKIDGDGNEIFHIFPSKFINENIYNLFSYENYILISDYKGNIKSIDKEGNILNETETKKIIANLNKELSGILRQDAVLARRIDDFINEKNLVMQGDRLLTTSIFKYREYFKMLNEYKKVYVKKSELNIDESSLGLWIHIGFDNEDNIYWDCKRDLDERRIVLIYSKYGELIDAFYNDAERSRVAVAPNGDVYFRNFDETGTHFWKTERRW